MSREITHGNLFSGSGTWELAAKLLGIKTLWEAEIEPFPVAVEAKRFPEAIQLGDVSKINGANIPPVDIMTNSSPCQDISNAGRRAGLGGSRSGLFHEAIRICGEMREADARRQLSSGRSDVDIRFLRPRFWCWENVPGSLSSGKPKGADFKVVLESIAGLVEKSAIIPIPQKGWSYAGVVDLEHGQIAWRMLDAQYELPQRRRRVFVVADLGGHSATEVLFESESLPWNFKTVADAWKGTTRSLEERIDTASRIIRGEISGTPCGMEKRTGVGSPKN